ncbi:preprotein translocase subunit Sec61beta [Candidatus Woesearchaeota archaeon]|nr:preprotein translocase subunit Sec61beta [Candidatus Woesearchaeota archaeon]
MADNKISMPSSGAGITRYSDEVPSKFMFKPGQVIILTVLVVAIVVLLHLYGKGWFGLP